MGERVHGRECAGLLRLSRALLQTRTSSELLQVLPSAVAEAFGFKTVVLQEPGLNKLSGSTATEINNKQKGLADTEESTTLTTDEAATVGGDRRVLSLTTGNEPCGYLLVEGARLSHATELQMQELIKVALCGARLAGQAMEATIAETRARDRRTLAEFLEQELRSSLTALKGAASTLLCMEPPAELRRELLTIVNEESDRINGFVSAASLVEIQVLQGSDFDAEVGLERSDSTSFGEVY